MGRTHAPAKGVTDEGHGSVEAVSGTHAFALASVAVVKGKTRVAANVAIVSVLGESVDGGGGRGEVTVVKVDSDAVAAAKGLKLYF
mgnify:FL=1